MAWQNCIRTINSFVDIWLVLLKDLTTVKIQLGLTYLKIQTFQVQDIKNLILPSDSVVSTYSENVVGCPKKVHFSRFFQWKKLKTWVALGKCDVILISWITSNFSNYQILTQDLSCRKKSAAGDVIMTGNDVIEKLFEIRRILIFLII